VADRIKTRTLAERLRSGRSRIASLKDRTRFLKSLIDNPRLTGAVSPSGRRLAQAMARAIGPARDGLVVELGPGTGPVTKALIESGVRPSDLLLVEFDAKFCRLLAARFPGVRVVQGDAYALERTLADHAGRPIRAIVSSLPLLNRPRAIRAALFEEIFNLMQPNGSFVQFTYGLGSPIPAGAWKSRISAHSSAPIWRNLPPARVWTYRAAPGVGAAESLFARLRRKAMPPPREALPEAPRSRQE
jgi:phosphatidylethanolamine/phosphatidyl-N-methylethanolamine N-methyltransferase